MGSVSVCVIGAGAAGLCAARHLSASSAVRKVTVFEQNCKIGGTWIYTDETGLNSWGLPRHSSMYKKMRTNLPKEVMGFPDFPFPSGGPSFVSHQQVLEYLEEYARHFDILKYIKFEQRVETVSLCDQKWKVIYHPVFSPERICEEFDSVFVCNGHYFCPSIPQLQDSEYYGGTVLHSHNYRTPEPFQGKTVLCLGAGPSGIDIAIEIAATCKRVYLSHNHKRITAHLPENLVQVPGILKFGNYGAYLLSLNEQGLNYVEFDAIIYCTGYKTEFPFFDSTVSVQCSDSRVTPLFHHLWEAEDFEFRVKDLGLKTNMAHYLGPLQWNYLKDLCKLGGLEYPIAPVVSELYDQVHKYRQKNLVTYKDEKFEIVNENEFRHF